MMSFTELHSYKYSHALPARRVKFGMSHNLALISVLFSNGGKFHKYGFLMLYMALLILLHVKMNDDYNGILLQNYILVSFLYRICHTSLNYTFAEI